MRYALSILLLLAGFTCRLYANEAELAGGRGSVPPESWTTNFVSALERARQERHPLLLVVAKPNCAYCERMRRVLSSAAFRTWVKGTGIYLAEAHLDQTNVVADAHALVDFVEASPHGERLELPYLGVYWPKTTNEAVRQAFTWRRGALPGGSHPTMTQEFMSAMDILLGDYFRTLGPRASTAEVAARALKRIQSACEGDGTVTMQPESGLMDIGSAVILKAAPGNRSVVFAGWRGPDGKMVSTGRIRRVLKVLPDMPAGTYTAIFRKRK